MPAKTTGASRRGAGSSTKSTDEKETKVTKTSGSGWSKLATRKEQIETAKDGDDGPREFWLKEGETATVQFLNDEPFCIDGHNVKWDNGKWAFTPCQLVTQRHCLMCRDGIKRTWKAVFKVLDYRGDWDKDKKRFKNNKQVEKIWFTGSTVAESIKALVDKRGKPLTSMVLEVTRSGSGKSSAYNFSVAFDEDDRKLLPVEWESEFAELEEIVIPLTDDQLEAKGFSAES